MHLNLKPTYICISIMDIDNHILPFLGKTVKLLDLYIEEELAKNDILLTKMQFVFLMIISKNNNQPQNNLAHLTGRDKTTFTRNISTLEKKGLVKRCLSEQDKRIKLVSITEAGTECLKKAYPIMHSIMYEVELGISEEERTSFMNTLTKIRTKLIALREQQI